MPSLDEADIIRQLIEETNALPRHELPTGFQWAMNHPSVLAYRTKDASRYDKDMRRAYFVEKARERGLENEGSPDLRAQLLRTTADDIRALKSAYEPYGADWPIYNSARWFSSLPGAAYAGSQMLANAVDPVAKPYPEAYDDFSKNVNNLAAFAEPMGRNRNHMRDMEDMRTAMASTPWTVLRPGESDDLIRQVYSNEAEPKTGSQVLAEAGVDGPAGKVLGGVMDATIDPFFSRSKTMGQFLMDYGLGSMHETVPLAVETIRKIRPAGEAYR